MISKGNGTFTVSGISTGDATELTVTYAKSGDGILAISSSTIGVTISGSASGSTITTDGVSTINLTFKNTTSSSGANLRIDDIVVKVKTAAVVKTNVGSFSSVSDQAVTKGGNIDFNPSEYYTDDAGVTGTTTFTVTPTSGDIYYSDGRIYATAYGSQVFTVTATPAAADEASYKSVSTSFTVNCADPRTAVNISSFSATNTTLIVSGSPSSTTTTVTNDQPGWTAAYTYTSSNEGVATVNSSGVITAVAKGTATITCSLNVDNDDPDYKAGSTTSKTVEITVNKPSHTVTFSVNGSTTRTAIVEEDQPITFPTAVETPSVASEFPKEINGMTFVGWYSSTYSHATDAPSYVNTASTNMGTSNVTYYAVYAEEDTDEEEVTKSYGFETESDVNWTVTGPTRNGGRANTGSYSGYINVNNSYVTFKNKVKVTEFSFAFTRTSTNNNYNVYIETSTDNSTWKAVETYAMSTFNSDGTYSVKSHTFDGKTALYVRFHCYNTTAARYVDDVTIKYNSTVTTYKNYCTTILGLPIPVTLNASGYATFCSEYPLDFSDYATSDYSAWQIIGVDEESITFSQITGSIKGGQGILLKGEASDEIILTNANSATVLSSNLLVGTVAPMSISADEYYGLSGNKFVKVNTGTVPAGKALLPASEVSSAREYTFVFEGDETTGVKTIDNGQLTIDNGTVYDLQGRKVTKPVKGGLYIVNGKKVIK